MYYIIHIATAFQSISAQPREVQELIWTRTQNEWRKKEPSHPILSASLDEYLNKQAEAICSISAALKTKMALTPEFGHIVAIGKVLAGKNFAPRLKVEITERAGQEKELLKNFWENIAAFTAKRGTPTFVTWNGLDFTFPFLIERSSALGVKPSRLLPRARFQPWKHLDLLAELADYDPRRYIDLRSRLTLWGLKLNGNGNQTGLRDPQTLIEEWRKGNTKPLKEDLILTLRGILLILKKIAPYLLEAKYHGQPLRWKTPVTNPACSPSQPISQ